MFKELLYYYLIQEFCVNNNFKNNLLLVVLLVVGCICAIFELVKFKKEVDNALNISKKAIKVANQAQKCQELAKVRSYTKALQCIEPIVEKNPDISIARLFYAEILLIKNQAKEAVSQIEYVLENEKNNTEVIILARELYEKAKDKDRKIKQANRLDIGSYYVELDNVIRWKNPEKIKVYISNDFNKKEVIKKAFLDWDEKLYGMVNFTFIDSPDEADITAASAHRTTVQQDNSDALGVTSLSYYRLHNNPKMQYFDRADILLAVDFDDVNALDDDVFYGITLHEIGHALGIPSHSPYIGDAMYQNTSNYSLGRITNRDVNTVKRIYGNI